MKASARKEYVTKFDKMVRSYRKLLDELTEENLTNALVKLTRLDKKQVYFVTGHNERPHEGEGAVDPGLHAQLHVQCSFRDTANGNRRRSRAMTNVLTSIINASDRAITT